MIWRLLSWLTGGDLEGIVRELGEAYEKKLHAESQQDRLEADKQITILKARQSVLIAEQSGQVTRWIRPAFAFPFITYNCKIILWDKVLGWGITDDLSPSFWTLQMVVFGAYFLMRPLERQR